MATISMNKMAVREPRNICRFAFSPAVRPTYGQNYLTRAMLKDEEGFGPAHRAGLNHICNWAVTIAAFLPSRQPG